MAIGPQTFTDLGGAVSDLFAGLAATTAANLKAQGLNIEAQGTDISSQATLLQAQGDIAEATQYGLAQSLAQQNAQYTATSTAIQAAQLDRQTSLTIGTQKAGYGGGGLAESGSALDVLRSSVQQGSLARSVLQTQGAITEAGFNEQAASYGVMKAAGMAAAGTETTIAGEQTTIAGEQRQLATETIAAGQQAQQGDFIASAMKGVAAVASLFIPGAAPLAPTTSNDPTQIGALY
jgi:hypothetical protein